MTKLRYFIPALALVLFCFDAHAETAKRDVAPFQSVSFSDAGDIEIAAGKAQSVTLDSEDQDLDDIKTEVRDDTLYITREKHWWMFGFGGPEHYRVRIELSHLAGVSIAGAARVRVNGLDGGDVTFSLTGATEMTAEGHADSLTLAMTGANKAILENLAVDTAVISTIGAGEALVNPAKALTVTVIGAGRVAYKGTPRITKTIVGGGTIEKLD